MNKTQLFGAAACCALAAAVSAAEVKVSELTGGAKQSTLELKAKNRVANGAFTVTAIPARFAGLTIVSVPRGQGNQPGAGYSVTIDRPAAVYLFVHNRGKATLPEGWAKVPGIVEWEANGQPNTDTVYLKEFPAGKIEVPAHDGKDGGKPDFFGVAPADAKFVSTRVVLDDDGDEAKVTGNLTLNGVTKSVTLDVDFHGAGANPFNKKATIGFEAETKIRRSDFGITYGIPMVSDEVELKIHAAFEKQ